MRLDEDANIRISVNAVSYKAIFRSGDYVGMGEVS